MTAGKMSLFLVVGLVVCMAYAESPGPPADEKEAQAPLLESRLDDSFTIQLDEPAQNRPAYQPPLADSTDSSTLPNPFPPELRRIREQIGSPLDGTIFGSPAESDLQDAFQKAQSSRQRSSDYAQPGDAYRGPRPNLNVHPDAVPNSPQQIPNYANDRSVPSEFFDPSISPGSRRAAASHLWSTAWNLDQQAYLLDRQGDHDLAEEIRTLTAKIRLKARGQ